MFDSVVHPRIRGRFGSGVVVSVLLHVAALVVALWLNARDDVPKAPPLDTITFVHAGPARAPNVASGPVAAPAKPQGARAHRLHSPSEPVVGQKIDPPELSTVDSSQTPDLDLPGTVGTGIGDAVPSTVGQGAASGVGSGPITFSAEQGMTMPRRLAGADPVYTREALEAGVQGTILARCVITETGAVEGCQILKGLPHLNQAVLEALRHQRYTPVTVHGRPVAVKYLFTFRMVLPGQ